VAGIAIFGDHEQRVVDQLERCLAAEPGARGALCADGHLGYSAPIGGVMAYREHVSPSGVGYDIGCGNKAVRTDLLVDDVRPAVPGLMDRIFAEISFGVGRVNDEPVDHPVLDAIRDAPFAPQRRLHGLAAKQLGTVGAGNHYVDLFGDEQDRVWVGVHFGSRGFGHRTASGFLSLAAGGRFDQPGRDGEMESPPTLLAVDTELGQAYVAGMELAGAYAYAGRDLVVEKVLSILGATAVEAVHNHHNFAWRERHGGDDWWVVRKGATPARPGQRGFVGSTMGEPSVILEGLESARSEAALYSTVHGAGRAMSRTAAAGRSRQRWTCLNRDCDWVQGAGEHKPADGRCPRCGSDRLAKRLVQVAPGAIDWDLTRAELADQGVELRGGAADEAPGAYKRLTEVLAHHEGTVRVLHTLTPLGVAMAGRDTFDPYKD
jgi:tRNA-splicing ligase RtcB (3'-phosphate/5'-hydroxy nucleic acid ligase)